MMAEMPPGGGPANDPYRAQQTTVTSSGGIGLDRSYVFSIAGILKLVAMVSSRTFHEF